MSATERAKSLASVLAFNDDVLTAGLAGMTDEQARRQLRENGPSVAWNIGHMLEHRQQIAAAMGCVGPAVDLEPYKRSATDGADYPTVEAFDAAWREFSARLLVAVNQASADTLMKPSPIKLPHGEQTVLDALRFVVWHEGLHLGQIAMLRSHHGLTPLATVLTGVAMAGRNA